MDKSIIEKKKLFSQRKKKTERIAHSRPYG